MVAHADRPTYPKAEPFLFTPFDSVLFSKPAHLWKDPAGGRG
jgi:hypothetical protein